MSVLKKILSERSRATLMIRIFGLMKIPLISYVKPSVVEVDEEKIVVKIPFRRRNRNHLNSLYFGALCVGVGEGRRPESISPAAPIKLGTHSGPCFFAAEEFELCSPKGCVCTEEGVSPTTGASRSERPSLRARHFYQKAQSRWVRRTWDTVEIKEFNSRFLLDDRVDISMLPVGAGLTLARKR